MHLRVLSAATIIAAVAAQSQLGGPSLVPDEVLTVNGGSLNIERRQEISVVEMSTQVRSRDPPFTVSGRRVGLQRGIWPTAMVAKHLHRCARSLSCFSVGRHRVGNLKLPGKHGGWLLPSAHGHPSEYGAPPAPLLRCQSIRRIRPLPTAVSLSIDRVGLRLLLTWFHWYNIYCCRSRQ